MTNPNNDRPAEKMPFVQPSPLHRRSLEIQTLESTEALPTSQLSRCSSARPLEEEISDINQKVNQIVDENTLSNAQLVRPSSLFQRLHASSAHDEDGIFPDIWENDFKRFIADAKFVRRNIGTRGWFIDQYNNIIAPRLRTPEATFNLWANQLAYIHPKKKTTFFISQLAVKDMIERTDVGI